MSMTQEQARVQLADDAITFLILWATEQAYDPENEQLVRTWADEKHLRIPSDTLDAKMAEAAATTLQRPPHRRPIAGPPAQPSAFLAAADLSFDGSEDFSDEFGAGPSAKRVAPHNAEGHAAKKPRVSQLAPPNTAHLDPMEYPYQNIGPAIGRKVKRYWGNDPAAMKRNKGNPWFEAVVTDYDADKGMHTITYQFLQNREEYEHIQLQLCRATDLQLMEEILDMHKLYMDDTKRRKSDALRKSKYLKNAYSGALKAAKSAAGLKASRSGSVGLYG